MEFISNLIKRPKSLLMNESSSSASANETPNPNPNSNSNLASGSIISESEKVLKNCTEIAEEQMNDLYKELPDFQAASPQQHQVNASTALLHQLALESECSGSEFIPDFKDFQPRKPSTNQEAVESFDHRELENEFMKLPEAKSFDLIRMDSLSPRISLDLNQNYTKAGSHAADMGQVNEVLLIDEKQVLDSSDLVDVDLTEMRGLMFDFNEMLQPLQLPQMTNSGSSELTDIDQEFMSLPLEMKRHEDHEAMSVKAVEGKEEPLELPALGTLDLSFEFPELKEFPNHFNKPKESQEAKEAVPDNGNQTPPLRSLDFIEAFNLPPLPPPPHDFEDSTTSLGCELDLNLNTDHQALNKRLIDKILNDVLSSEDLENAKAATEDLVHLLPTEDGDLARRSVNKEIENLLVEINEKLTQAGCPESNDFLEKQGEMVKMSPLPAQVSRVPSKLAVNSPTSVSSTPSAALLNSSSNGKTTSVEILKDADENSNLKTNSFEGGKLSEVEKEAIFGLADNAATDFEARALDITTSPKDEAHQRPPLEVLHEIYDDNNTNKDMKLSPASAGQAKETELLPTAVNLHDVLFDEMAMDVDLNCTETFENIPSKTGVPVIDEVVKGPRLTFGLEEKEVEEKAAAAARRQTMHLICLDSPQVKLPHIKATELPSGGVSSFKIDSRTRTPTPNPDLNVTTSRTATPILDQTHKLDATLDMTSNSFASARSSATNSPVHFPAKEVPALNKFPKASSSSQLLSELASETDLEASATVANLALHKSSTSVAESLTSLVDKPVESSEPRRTFCLSTIDFVSNDKSFPLTSSLDANNDEINDDDVGIEMLIDKQEKQRRTFSLAEAERSRKTFSIENKDEINQEQPEAETTEQNVTQTHAAPVSDDFEPMDVDVSMQELNPLNDQTQVFAKDNETEPEIKANRYSLNETAEMVELNQTHSLDSSTTTSTSTPSAAASTSTSVSPPLPTMQKRQAIELPPSIDIIPLANSLLNKSAHTFKPIEVPAAVPAPAAVDETFDEAAMGSETRGLLTKSETFNVENQAPGSPPLPAATSTGPSAFSPPIPTHMNKQPTELRAQLSPPLPTLLSKHQPTDPNELLASEAIHIKEEPKDQNEFQSFSPPLPTLIKAQEKLLSEEIKIKEEQKDENEFRSLSPPLPTLMKAKENLPEPSSEIITAGSETLAASPPLPAQTAMNKRKSFDDTPGKNSSMSSPAQLAKIQKRRPLHQHHLQNFLQQKQQQEKDELPQPEPSLEAASSVDQALSAKEQSCKDEKEYFEKKYAESSLDEVFGATFHDAKQTAGDDDDKDIDNDTNVEPNQANNEIPDFEEDFRNADRNIILNPSDFEFLLTKGNNNAPINRNSILLKFDPLIGSPALANQPLQQTQSNFNINNNIITTVTEEDESHQLSQDPQTLEAGLADSRLPTHDKHNNSSSNNKANLVVAAGKKEDNIAAAQLSEAEVELRLGGGGFGAKKSLSKKADATMSADVIKDISIDNDSNKCFDNLNLEPDDRKLSYKMDELEKKIQNEVSKTEDIEKKLQESEMREEALIKRITDKDKTINKMNGVIEAYEKAIAELISEKEQVSQNFEKELNEVKNDRDSYYHHLTSLESTFADLHIKYEKSKEMTAQLKANEELLLTEKKQHLENLKLLEQRYDKMKHHAMQQLEIANEKLATLTKEHQMEITKLKALWKKETINNASLKEQLQQKVHDNAELVRLIDELINEHKKS